MAYLVLRAEPSGEFMKSKWMQSLLLLVLTACYKAPTQAPEPTYTYSFTGIENTCKIEQSFDNFEKFCASLLDSTNGCALEQRQKLYVDSGCTQNKVSTISTTSLKAENIPIDSFGVDIRDIVKYKAGLKEESQTIMSNIANKADWYLPAGVRFLPQGPGFDSSTRENTVFGVEIISRAVEQDVIKLTLSVLYKRKGVDVQIRQLGLTMSANQIQSVQFLNEFPAKDLKFHLEVSLVDRKLMLIAEDQGVFKIFPLGVGGFDEGVKRPGGTQLLTRTYPDAVVNPKNMAASVTTPSYFMGRPFITISTATGARTGYGFHYSITPTLLRGFVSHGCMRMVDKDLYELFELLRSVRLPVNAALLLKSEIEYDHPYTLQNDRYERVKNFGTPAAPSARFGTDGLVITEKVIRPPPIEKLFNDDPMVVPYTKASIQDWNTEAALLN